MKKVSEGLEKFKNESRPKFSELLKTLATSQNPEALIISCADSRVEPAFFTQTDPGTLFTCRNVGNLVPNKDSSENAVHSAVLYAVDHLKVQHIIVCGHSNCGAMNANLNGLEKLDEGPLKSWLSHACPVQEETDVDDLARQNVLFQVEKLTTLPCVKKGLENGDLNIHAWFYDIGHGTVFAHNGQSFIPLND